MKYIFITGGVISSVGKGVTAAATGALLEAKGYKVRIKKMDPYLNIDPGTMSPYEHGEVFVTEDGAETDLDLGHYERFTSVNCKKTDSISSGKIFYNVLQKERVGDYLGKTVQIIPHITTEIKNFIEENNEDSDFVICEIGGTVGDIEANPFLEAVRQFANDKGWENILFIHVPLIIYADSSNEFKTKPAQHSVKAFQSTGINPNILVCRTKIKLTDEIKNKLALFCNVSKDDVISAADCQNIYEVIPMYNNEKLDERIIKYFKLKDTPADLSSWQDIINTLNNVKEEVNLAMVGKYVVLQDAYKSLIEALKHGSISNKVKVNLKWISSEELEDSSVDLKEVFNGIDGILVPGGFGNRGIEGMVKAIAYAREKDIPFFAICLGMQLMVIEAFRNVIKLDDVGSSEFGNYKNPVVSLITEWENNGNIEVRTKNDDLGGTMRLGAYPCNLKKGSLAYEIYNSDFVFERHRHRYEININYKDKLESSGYLVSGISPDNRLCEIIEIPNKRWFLGVQFHPELKSKPHKIHPLFHSFIEAMKKYKNKED